MLGHQRWMRATRVSGQRNPQLRLVPLRRAAVGMGGRGSQPPMRGWDNYFRYGNSGRKFSPPFYATAGGNQRQSGPHAPCGRGRLPPTLRTGRETPRRPAPAEFCSRPISSVGETEASSDASPGIASTHAVVAGAVARDEDHSSRRARRTAAVARVIREPVRATPTSPAALLLIGHRTAAKRGETNGRTAPTQAVPWHDRFHHSGVVVPAMPMPRTQPSCRGRPDDCMARMMRKSNRARSTSDAALLLLSDI